MLAVIGLFGGDDDGGDERASKQERRQERKREERRQERRQERASEQAAEVVSLRLVMNSDVAVCLLGDSERPLIDGQVLVAGNEESFEAKRFSLRFPSGYDRGQFELLLNGERRRLPETLGPAAFVITPPDRVREAPEPGTDCP